MIFTKKIFLFVLALTITVLLVACQNETTERTTVMSSSNITNKTVSTEAFTSETTSENIVPVNFASINLVTENPSVDNLLEFDLYEPDSQPVIQDNYNPYDYSQIKVKFVFTKPSGDFLTQYAFWYKDYKEINVIGKVINNNGFYTSGQELIDWGENSTSHYRVRINPDEPGKWSYQMSIIIKGVTTQILTDNFQVLSNDTRTNGYIEVDKVNNRNFVFSRSNETYIPSGLNLAWPATTLNTHDYYNWFKKLHMENGNMARVWMANWSFSLHKFSYDNFDSRQNMAARLDLLFEFAKDDGIYIMLTLLNHGQFSSKTNPEWAENPYNIKNGGMLQYPIQFFYNKEAKAIYKNELQYIIGRYGYSENIFAWELFNEVDWIDGYNATIVGKWHDEMAQFIHSMDPYNHLVTTSYKYTFGTPAFSYDSLDFCSFHSYDYSNVLFYDKFVGEMTSLWDKYQKPVLFGEIGIDWEAGSSTYSSDYTGVSITQGAWGGIMSSAGSADQWWWDSWIDKYDLWDCFKGAYTYKNYIDVANKQYTLLQESDTVLINNSSVKIMGYLLNDAIYGYIYNDDWNYWKKDPDSITGVSISIPFVNGNYTLSIFDTVTGEVINQQQVVVVDNIFTIDSLTITKDYAFILK